MTYRADLQTTQKKKTGYACVYTLCTWHLIGLSINVCRMKEETGWKLFFVFFLLKLLVNRNIDLFVFHFELKFPFY